MNINEYKQQESTKISKDIGNYTCLNAGELTSYIYDNRNRWISKTVQPNTVKSLTSNRFEGLIYQPFVDQARL